MWELSADEGGQGLRGGHASGQCHNRDPGQAPSRCLAKRGSFITLQRLDGKAEQYKSCDVKAVQRTDIVTLHQAKPDAEAG